MAYSSIPAYTLKAYPKASVLDPTFVSFAEAVPPGKFYLFAPITVPFTPLPQTFIVYTDAWDRVLRVFVNGNEQARVIPLQAGSIFSSPSDPQGFHIEVPIPLNLAQGANQIHVTIDNGQTFDLLVVSSSIASLFRAYSTDLFQRVLYPLQTTTNALLSPWSPMVMESLLRFQDELPDLRTPRTHSIKLIVKAMMAYSGTNLGVTDFATGLVYNTPIIRGISDSDYGDLNYCLNLRQDVNTGKDFHMWLPSKGAARWLAFVNLLNNLPNEFKIVDFGEEEVDVEDVQKQNIIEQHQFSFGPDMWDILDEMPRIKIGVHPRKRTYVCFGMYNYRYPLGLKVLYPLGNHILGRRPRHMGPISSNINLSGTTTVNTASGMNPLSVVVDNWGVNPASSSKINAILVADPTDTTYIFSMNGGGRAETFRFDLSSIPSNAVINSATLNISARGIGTGSSIGLISTQGGVTTVLAEITPTHNYAPFSATLSFSGGTNVNNLSSIAFGVRDDSARGGYVRVTKMSLDVQWTLPLWIQVMKTDFRLSFPTGTTSASIGTALGTAISNVEGLLSLVVSVVPNTINIRYVPALDKWGEVIHLKLFTAPPGITITFEDVAGHTLGTNDGVDIWAANDHFPILTTFTDPITKFQFPRTITPEIGFLGHSLTSTRMSGGHQMTSYIPPVRSTALWGTMSGYFPQYDYLGVGSLNATSQSFTFPNEVFTSDDVGRALVVTYSSFQNNLQRFVVTSISGPNTLVCSGATNLTTDSSILGKFAYRCTDQRSPRVPGPQCRLLSESRVEQTVETE